MLAELEPCLFRFCAVVCLSGTASVTCFVAALFMITFAFHCQIMHITELVSLVDEMNKLLASGTPAEVSAVTWHGFTRKRFDLKTLMFV